MSIRDLPLDCVLLILSFALIFAVAFVFSQEPRAAFSHPRLSVLISGKVLPLGLVLFG
ncbi:MAG TPA: hypothetical protein VGK21_05600 [Candidatus Angelobacter sp.]|jgi:hypothetical protein